MTSPPPATHHDDQAEQALLGAMLISAQAVAQALTLTTPTQLYRPHNQLLWHTITNAPEWGDPTIITSILLQTGNITRIPNGANYLHDCIRTCPNPANITYYAQAINQAATLRTRHETLTRLRQALDNPDPTAWDNAWTTAQTQLQPPQAAANGHKHIELIPASSYRPKPVRWLWDARMPLGELTLIPGREGVGKSILMAWLAAAITNGNLPGRYHGTPRAVLYAATEDSWEHTIATRLIAAGARMNMIHHIQVRLHDGSHRGLLLPEDTPDLPAAAHSVDAAVLICDPIISMVDERINSFKAQELRKALEPLKAAAEAAGIACAALVHFNKTAGADIMTMISGSRAWGEVARACLAVARDDEADEPTNVLTQVKNNLGRLDLPSLTYTIDDVTVETDVGEPAHPGRLRWLGETDTTAIDLLGGATGRARSDTTLAIIEFVADMAPHAVALADVAEHFKDTMRHEAVRQVLSRCLKRGDLVSLRRGLYELPPKPGRRRPR